MSTVRTFDDAINAIRDSNREDQRMRILAACDDEAWEYDLAVALGYEPESWDGMWKLTPKPFTYRNGYVIVREATGFGKSRLVARHMPQGWTVDYDYRLTEAEPRHILSNRAADMKRLADRRCAFAQ